MKKLITGLILLSSLQGCTENIRIPLDYTPLSSDQSTIVVWMDQKPMLFNQDVPILIDGIEVGILGAKKPLKITTSPGEHIIYGSLEGMVIDRELKINLKPGEVSFYRVYLKCGMWVCSVYTASTLASTHYDSVIHIIHDD